MQDSETFNRDTAVDDMEGFGGRFGLVDGPLALTALFLNQGANTEAYKQAFQLGLPDAALRILAQLSDDSLPHVAYQISPRGVLSLLEVIVFTTLPIGSLAPPAMQSSDVLSLI